MATKFNPREVPSMGDLRAAMTEFIETTHFDEPLPDELPPDPDAEDEGEETVEKLDLSGRNTIPPIHL